jgi:hypothetical protein
MACRPHHTRFAHRRAAATILSPVPGKYGAGRMAAWRRGDGHISTPTESFDNRPSPSNSFRGVDDAPVGLADLCLLKSLSFAARPWGLAPLRDCLSCGERATRGSTNGLRTVQSSRLHPCLPRRAVLRHDPVYRRIPRHPCHPASSRFRLNFPWQCPGHPLQRAVARLWRDQQIGVEGASSATQQGTRPDKVNLWFLHLSCSILKVTSPSKNLRLLLLQKPVTGNLKACFSILAGFSRTLRNKSSNSGFSISGQTQKNSVAKN